MNITMIRICLMLGMIFLVACRDPFVPDLPESDSILVVEGRLSDDPAGSIFILSRSFGFDQVEDSAIRVRGAEIFIEEENGEVHVASESEPGLYQTDPTVFLPEIGQRYRLLITTREGASLESDFVEMTPSPEIGSLTNRVVFQENPDGTTREGVEFLINSFDESATTTYYGWTYEETWEFFAPFPKRAEWIWEPEPRVVLIPPDEEVEHCWSSNRSSNILISTSEQLSEDRIVDFPVHFVSVNSGRLYYGYSLLVNQFALSREEYEYLRAIRQNTEQTGSIFDPVPAELGGNIRYVGDSTRPVVGYFAASEVQSSRIFMERSFFPDSIEVATPLGYCSLNLIPFQTIFCPAEQSFEKFRIRIEGLGNAYIDTLFFGTTPVGWQWVLPDCADCKLTGTPIKPSFWPN